LDGDGNVVSDLITNFINFDAMTKVFSFTKHNEVITSVLSTATTEQATFSTNSTYYDCAKLLDMIRNVSVDGVVKSINGFTPNENGEISLTAETIPFEVGDPSPIKEVVDTLADHVETSFVKLYSPTTQDINSDLALAEGHKFFGTNSAGEQHEIIGLNEYATGQQTEVGSERVATCINHAEVEN
jgi:hypothetical protein